MWRKTPEKGSGDNRTARIWLQGERMFFFEKKNQKTFASWRALVTSPRQLQNVF
jgi:hypothetical protein